MRMTDGRPLLSNSNSNNKRGSIFLSSQWPFILLLGLNFKIVLKRLLTDLLESVHFKVWNYLFQSLLLCGYVLCVSSDSVSLSVIQWWRCYSSAERKKQHVHTMLPVMFPPTESCCCFIQFAVLFVLLPVLLGFDFKADVVPSHCSCPLSSLIFYSSFPTFPFCVADVAPGSFAPACFTPP